MCKVLLGDLEKVDWVVLKCDYAITPNSINWIITNIQKNYLWNQIHGTNRQILYGINNHLNEDRFFTEMDIQNNIDRIFKSDCDVINHHLHQNYNFNIFGNKYKYYLPNLMRHYGFVDKDHVPHIDYPYKEKEYKTKPPLKNKEITKQRKKRNN